MKPDLPGWRDVPIACVCGASGPFYVLAPMAKGFRKRGRALMYVAAHLVNCQRCGRDVLVDGQGVVERHQDAKPALPPSRPLELDRYDPPRGPEPQIEQKLYPPRTPPPLPRKRPRV